MAGVILYSGLAIVLAMLVAYLMSFPRPRAISPQEIEAMGSTFDFVVVGGGTTGCLIALNASSLYFKSYSQKYSCFSFTSSCPQDREVK